MAAGLGIQSSVPTGPDVAKGDTHQTALTLERMNQLLDAAQARIAALEEHTAATRETVNRMKAEEQELREELSSPPGDGGDAMPSQEAAKQLAAEIMLGMHSVSNERLELVKTRQELEFTKKALEDMSKDREKNAIEMEDFVRRYNAHRQALQGLVDELERAVRSGLSGV